MPTKVLRRNYAAMENKSLYQIPLKNFLIFKGFSIHHYFL